MSRVTRRHALFGAVAACGTACLPEALLAGFGRPADTATGTLKWFDPYIAAGFVVPDDGGKDMLIKAKTFREAGVPLAKQGMRMRVGFRSSEKTKGARVVTRIMAFDPETALWEANFVPPPCGPDRVEMKGVAYAKWFNRVRGFGFLSRGPGAPDIFVHVEVLRKSQLVEMRPGSWYYAYFGLGQKGCSAGAVRPLAPHEVLNVCMPDSRPGILLADASGRRPATGAFR